jgi:hypothetical protein
MWVQWASGEWKCIMGRSVSRTDGEESRGSVGMF